MLLQGFPKKYELKGTLSSQIIQVSEAVPPPMAAAVAKSIMDLLASLDADWKVALRAGPEDALQCVA